MSGLAILNDFVTPIGALISIIFISMLCASLAQDFLGYKKYQKSTKVNTHKLQIASMVTFITYILYNVGQVLGRWAFDVTACSVRMPMFSCLWSVTRGALYFFLLIRVEVSFAGSSYATKPIFINAFGAFIVILYALNIFWSIYTRHDIQFDPIHRMCVPKRERIARNHNITYAILAIDFLIGVAICGLFAHKLRGLHKAINTHVDENETDIKRTNFIIHAKKQTKLAFVAFITTLLALYIMPATKYASFPFLDTLINVLCVYCTFSFDMPSRMYWCLCECSGNKCCLCVFCFCCWCCNLPITQSRLNSTSDIQGDGQTMDDDLKQSDLTTNTVDTTTAPTGTDSTRTTMVTITPITSS